VRSKVLVTSGVSSDELGGSHLLRILLLPLRVGDGGDVGTQGLGEQEGKVTQSTDSNDSDINSGSTSVRDQRVVNGYSSTKHRSGHSGVETIGDLDDEMSRGTVVGCVSSERLVTLGFTLLELSTVGSLEQVWTVSGWSVLDRAMGHLRPYRYTCSPSASYTRDSRYKSHTELRHRRCRRP
jgi:hypothetical protein